MSKLKIHSVADKGDLSKECVWLQVLEDIADLGNYMLCDTTYIDANQVSNELRHLYWFPSKAVKKGDWVRLMTGSGTNAATDNNLKSKTHTFYWKLGRTVWNKAGDAAVLFNLSSRSILKV